MRLFLLLILMSLNVNAQNTLIGHVVGNDKNDIPNSKIMYQGNEVYSDSLGFFIISTWNDSIDIQVSHISYQSVNKTLHFETDTLYTDIILKDKIDVIGQIELIAFDDFADKVRFLDIELLGGTVVALCSYNNKSYLAMNVDGSWIRYKLLKKAKELKKDCLGNLHLKFKNEYLEFDIESNELEIIGVVSDKEYSQYFDDCDLIINDKAVYHFYRNHNQNLLYTMISDSSSKLIAQVYDEVGHKVSQSHYNSIIADYYAAVGCGHNIIETGIWDGNLMQLAVTNKLFLNICWYSKIISKPIYNPIFKVNGDLVVFNFQNNRMETLDSEGEKIQMNAIDFHSISTWNKKLIQDEYLEDIYTEYKNKGYYSYHKIDSNISQQAESFVIYDEFPNDIHIYNNTVYYLTAGKLKTTNTSKSYYY